MFGDCLWAYLFPTGDCLGLFHTKSQRTPKLIHFRGFPHPDVVIQKPLIHFFHQENGEAFNLLI
ncbi:hypothetical protein P872_20780 [Rhodonellum psychrophilum GCM71 = DSM 17998]|uniref:Uncharacterized protein n=1 Tax=Rhodonellum psychrophilum GCM71 = DSM 17998 TaxID=1123057 RepID=U5BWV1_9BACT|nr:hypothetical protein P872_20780 [Rhodonellum psychrophilum GCM71 = DSM 17998]